MKYIQNLNNKICGHVLFLNIFFVFHLNLIIFNNTILHKYIHCFILIFMNT